MKEQFLNLTGLTELVGYLKTSIANHKEILPYASNKLFPSVGDINTTYICVMHKARALGNLYFWNKYYRKNNMSKRMKNYVPDEWALEIISESELNMLKELERED